MAKSDSEHGGFGRNRSVPSDCKTDGSPIDIDVLNHLWEFETKRGAQ